ncbi:MAG TPA: hypothetical protein PLI17_17650, partial [Denitromonas sp.]|nr:hypothetical protein [Denitromonas sp.]
AQHPSAAGIGNPAKPTGMGCNLLTRRLAKSVPTQSGAAPTFSTVAQARAAIDGQGPLNRC